MQINIDTIDLSKVDSVVLRRLIQEVKDEQIDSSNYNRSYNRYNRDGSKYDRSYTRHNR